MGQVLDVVLKESSVGSFQSQQIFVASFHNLQLILGVFGLALVRKRGERNRKQEHRKWGVDNMLMSVILRQDLAEMFSTVIGKCCFNETPSARN